MSTDKENKEDILLLGNGANVTASFAFTNDSIELEIDDQWCGSTETGFGSNVNYSINITEAEELARRLNRWLETKNTDSSA